MKKYKNGFILKFWSNIESTNSNDTCTHLWVSLLQFVIKLTIFRQKNAPYLPPNPKGIRTHRSVNALTPPLAASNLSGSKLSGCGK